MGYCVQDDIEKKIPEDVLIELTDDAGTGAVITAALDRAIVDADEEIDSFVSTRYSLPFATTPGLIRLMSVDLAICNLYARRPHLDIPESREKRCDADRKLLERIASGSFKLATPAPSDTSGSVEITNADRIFSREKMEGF